MALASGICSFKCQIIVLNSLVYSDFRINFKISPNVRDICKSPFTAPQKSRLRAVYNVRSGYSKWSNSLEDQLFEASVQTEQTAAQYTACVCVAFHAKLRRVRKAECAAQKLHSSGSHGTAAMLVSPLPVPRMRRSSFDFRARAWRRVRRTALLTHSGSRTGVVIALKQLEWLLHKSQSLEWFRERCNF